MHTCFQTISFRFRLFYARGPFLQFAPMLLLRLFQQLLEPLCFGRALTFCGFQERLRAFDLPFRFLATTLFPSFSHCELRNTHIELLTQVATIILITFQLYQIHFLLFFGFFQFLLQLVQPIRFLLLLSLDLFCLLLNLIALLPSQSMMWTMFIALLVFALVIPIAIRLPTGVCPYF